jgi:hypothetical protein
VIEVRSLCGVRRAQPEQRGDNVERVKGSDQSRCCGPAEERAQITT